MFSENGSGGVMSDITFTGGNFGFCKFMSPDLSFVLMLMFCQMAETSNSVPRA